MMAFEELKPNIKELAEKYHLSMVVIFGSQVTGKTHLESDIDLGFLPKRAMGLKEIAEMGLEFSQNLKLKNLDLVNLKGASPFLLKEVADNSILLYEQNSFEYANFKIYAFKRFVEAKPLLALRESSLKKFLKTKTI